MKKAGLVFIGAMFLCGTLWAGGPNFVEIEKIVNDLREKGLIVKITPDLNEVFVLKKLWDAIPFEDKKLIGAIIGYYCGNKNGRRIYRVEIRDHLSGKNLAKWSETFGLTVY